MTVWYAIPSARPVPQVLECLGRWREMGYRLAVARDDPESMCEIAEAMGEGLWRNTAHCYPGYSTTVNTLVTHILDADPDAAFVVAGGDDMHPDPRRRADEIETETAERYPDLFGVMQPTGDSWPPRDASGRFGSERVCGSPWLGRGWCERAYGGLGPLWSGYHHFYADEELQVVAERLGVLWQRPDLSHRHDHWMREARPRQPAHLSHTNWDRDQTLWKQRSASGFPQHEPME